MKYLFLTTVVWNYKSITGGISKNSQNSWKLNKILMNNQWVKEEIKKGIFKYLDTNENGHTTYQSI